MGREALRRALRLLVAVAATAGFAAMCGLPGSGVAVASAAPVNSSPPSIAGKTKDGGKLKASAGTWSGQRPITYAYQWTRCDGFGNACEDIASARSRVYKVVSKDVGHAIRVLVTATDATGSSTEMSAPTNAINAVAPKRKGAPKITGLLEDGQTLTVPTGTWKGTTPLFYGYQWESCDTTAANCSYIPGAKGPSYQIVSSQIGGKLRALITATGPGGLATVTSRPTTLIGPGPPVNSSPPTISGSLQEGQTLAAAPGTWAGTAPFVFGYQWERCSVLGAGCEEIPGATSSTYTLGPLDVASKLAVVVTASNAQGAASATSAETSAIGALPPSNTLPPSITGTLRDGQLLSVGNGSWSGTEPLSYSYQWQLCNAVGEECEEIGGATGATFRLSPHDVGRTLDALVTATNAGGSSAVTAPATATVAGILPLNTALPTITGVLKEGQLLSVGTGSWSGTEPINFSYQWQLCDPLGEGCVEIEGATGASLALSSGDIGGVLNVVVTATNVAGSTSVTTPVTTLIEGLLPVNNVLPTITGLFKEGGLLSVGTGSWSGTEPLSYSYQWELCGPLGEACNNISEATGSSLKLSSLDIGKTLAVVVKATNVAGSTSVTTSLTSLIEGLLPVNNVLPSISGLFKEGGLLSVGTGSWSGSEPISYSYQWQLCEQGKSCNNISEATRSSLKLSSLDIGKTLDVVVKATNVAGSTSVTTPVTSLIEGLLPVNNVLPSISGVLKEGQLLSVGTGSWSGSEPISYSYQWQLCEQGKSCNNISEATGPSLSLSSLDIGKTLDVVVKATNVAGSTSVTTSVTGLIEGLLPVNTLLPSVTGTLLEGKSLTANSGSWTGTAPISYSYQWQLCEQGKSCDNISEATASALSLIAPYVGDTVDVVVKASNVAGSTTATSAVTQTILGIAPVNTALPVISGLLEVGKVLSVSKGSWSGTTPMSFKYQWQLCLLGTCTNIGGATGETLTLLGLDVGNTIDAIVTATNVTGSSLATSKPTEKLLGIL